MITQMGTVQLPFIMPSSILQHRHISRPDIRLKELYNRCYDTQVCKDGSLQSMGRGVDQKHKCEWQKPDQLVIAVRFTQVDVIDT
jgi:hypothetical protein